MALVGQNFSQTQTHHGKTAGTGRIELEFRPVPINSAAKSDISTSYSQAPNGMWWAGVRRPPATSPLAPGAES